MRRSTYIAIIFSIIIFGAAVSFFFYWRSANIPSAPQITTQPAGEGLPPVQPQTFQTSTPREAPPPSSMATPRSQFTVVALNPVADFFVGKDRSVLIIEPGGKIARVAGGNTDILSVTPIAQLHGASFSYDGKRALALFGSSQNPQTSIFNVEKKLWSPLSGKFQSAAWSPTDYRIAYVAEKSGAASLGIADAANERIVPQVVLTLHVQDLHPIWGAPSQIFLADRASAFSASALLSFDLKKKTLSLVAQNQPGLETLWEPTLNKGLVFYTGSGRRGGVLAIASRDGTVLHELNFLTLPEKCVLAPQGAAGAAASTSTPPYLYCAVPRNQQALNMATLPDDYNKRAIRTADDFYRVNLATGDLTIIFSDQNQVIDAYHLKIFGQALYFINRYDERLCALTLQ